MGFCESKIRVRYAETDQMGVVYHANYYVWFEVGRSDCLRMFGMTYKDMEAQGIIMPITETHCKYKQPAMYDDMLTVRTTIKEISYVRMSFHYTLIRDADSAVLAEGETVHAFTNSSKKPISIKRVNPDLYSLLVNAKDQFRIKY
jgi:acyl-CoA thioester hydrolase